MEPEEVWRKVDGQAVLCTECPENDRMSLYADRQEIDDIYHCNAPEGICAMLQKPIDRQKPYGSFREVFKEIQDEIKQAVSEASKEDDA